MNCGRSLLPRALGSSSAMGGIGASGNGADRISPWDLGARAPRMRGLVPACAAFIIVTTCSGISPSHVAPLCLAHACSVLISHHFSSA